VTERISENPGNGDSSQRRLRVGWVAGPHTLEDFGCILQPLAIGLMDELVDLTVFCPRRADLQELPVPPVEAVRFGRLGWLGMGAKKAVESLASQLRSRKIDLLHALEASAAPLAHRLGRLAGVNYVVSSYALGDGRLLGWGHHRASAVLASCETVRQDLLKHHAAAGENVLLVRPGVYYVRQATCFTDPRHSVAIVAAGPLDDFIGFNAVLEAFAELRARKYDCVFFIIGAGRAERRLRMRAEQLNIRQELTFAGRQPASQLPGIFKAADIYVSPTPTRRFDVVSLLAMASGVPVLAAAGAVGDFLIDGRTAIMFDRGDSAALTMKLIALLDDRAAGQDLAENAMGQLRAGYSPAGMVSAVARIYRRVVAGQPG